MDLGKFRSLDNYQLHLSNLVKKRMGRNYELYIHINFEEIEEGRVCRVDIDRSSKLAYLEEDNKEVFYVRGDNHSEKLQMSEAKEYIDEHWE